MVNPVRNSLRSNLVIAIIADVRTKGRESITDVDAAIYAHIAAELVSFHLASKAVVSGPEKMTYSKMEKTGKALSKEGHILVEICSPNSKRDL